MESPSSVPLKEQVRSSMVLSLNNTLTKLFKVWNIMGVDEHQKRSRAEAFHTHVRKLMDDMTVEEENLMKKLKKSIDEHTEKLHELCAELGCSIPKLEPSLTMVQRERILHAKVESLVSEKKGRMTKLKSLQSEDEALSECMGSSTYDILSSLVPSIEQLRDLETHVKAARVEKEKRAGEFLSQKQKVTGLYELIEVDPEDSFAHDVVCEDTDSFKLTHDNMDKLKDLVEKLTKKQDDMRLEADNLWGQLKSLWTILETPDLDRESFEYGKEGYSMSIITALKAEIASCNELKMQNMHKFVERIRDELKVWWEKCYMSVENQNSFRALYDQDCTEQLLEVHEKELERMRTYYETHKAVLTKIDCREELFKQMIVFDEKTSDPNRLFKNRGGTMLQEEKARKKLMTDLPKLEEEVAALVAKWEQDNDAVFLVRGCSFVEYTEKQWAEFYAEKERKKQERMKSKEKKTKEEMMFGSSSVLKTPSKKRQAPISTPSRTPLKTKKLNDNTKTPNTTSKLLTSRTQHSTMLQSPYSRKPLYTPKTASTSKGRRSIRLLRKAMTEKRRSSKRRSKVFSHTTVSSEDHASSTLASTGSYDDFANGLTNPNCRSSAVPSAVMFPVNRK